MFNSCVEKMGKSAASKVRQQAVESESDDAEYIVEHISRMKTVKGKRQFYIKWKVEKLYFLPRVTLQVRAPGSPRRI